MNETLLNLNISVCQTLQNFTVQVQKHMWITKLYGSS